MKNLESILKSRDITLLTKVCRVEAMVFSVVMYGRERWTVKKAECWRIFLNCGVGEDSWESLRLQGDQTVNPEGNQSWMFIGWTDAEAETPILWPPDAKNWLSGKDPDAGKGWRQEEKRMTEDEMVGWHHWLNGHESERTRRWCRAEEPGVHVQGVAKSWTGFRKWTTINKTSQADLSLSHTLARGLA